MYYIGRGGGDCLCYCILLVYIILSSALSFSELMCPLVIELPAAIILKELQPFGFQHELRAVCPPNLFVAVPHAKSTYLKCP